MVLPLVLRLITGESGVFVARMKKLAGLYVIVGLLAVALLFFLTLALFVWTAQHFGILQTALGFAGVVFVLLLAVLIALKASRRKPDREAEVRLQRDIASIAGVAALSNAPQMLRAVGRNKSLLALPVAGIAAVGIYLFVRNRERV